MDCQELIDTEDASLISRSNALCGPDQDILLVEDERLVREVAGEILNSAGYRVWKAASAAEALHLFEQHHAEIKLLISDVVLPDARGPQLALKMQATAVWVRTILISGYPERMIMKGACGESMFFYLAKPFSAETLIRKVRQVLSPHEMSGSTH